MTNVLLESEKLSKKNKGLIKMVNNYGLENKYFTWKQMREKAEKDIAKMEDLDVENMTQERLEAREQVIKMSKEEIEEAKEMLEKIKEELVEFVNNGGEVSEKTKEEIFGEDTEEDEFEVESMFEDEIRTNIKKACESYNFVGIVCEDGHEHTVKSFGEVCGTPFTDFDDELDNQIQYCLEISNGFDVEVITANTKQEAIQKYILEENGDYK